MGVCTSKSNSIPTQIWIEAKKRIELFDDKKREFILDFIFNEEVSRVLDSRWGLPPSYLGAQEMIDKSIGTEETFNFKGSTQVKNDSIEINPSSPTRNGLIRPDPFKKAKQRCNTTKSKIKMCGDIKEKHTSRGFGNNYNPKKDHDFILNDSVSRGSSRTMDLDDLPSPHNLPDFFFYPFPTPPNLSEDDSSTRCGSIKSSHTFAISEELARPINKPIRIIESMVDKNGCRIVKKPILNSKVSSGSYCRAMYPRVTNCDTNSNISNTSSRARRIQRGLKRNAFESSYDCFYNSSETKMLRNQWQINRRPISTRPIEHRPPWKTF